MIHRNATSVSADNRRRSLFHDFHRPRRPVRLGSTYKCRLQRYARTGIGGVSSDVRGHTPPSLSCKKDTRSVAFQLLTLM